ncbi:TPA: hypothetical protein ACHU7U_000914 [Streptococcus suis]
MLDEHHFVEGDTIGIFDSKTGDMVEQYIYDGDSETWFKKQQY